MDNQLYSPELQLNNVYAYDIGAPYWTLIDQFNGFVSYKFTISIMTLILKQWLKNAKTNVLQCIGYLSSTKDRIKIGSLQTLALALLQIFLNYIYLLPQCYQISCNKLL